MAKKKQFGGQGNSDYLQDLTSQGLIQPGDDTTMDPNTNLLEETKSILSEPIETTDFEYLPTTGVQLKNIDHESYTKYIDRPFSYISDDAQDLRAQSQSTGEKWVGFLPKLVTRVGTNILGSTVGLVYGGGAFLGGLFDGPEGENATKSFFDNDFQRGLDGINEWMDGALPNYYTKEEKDYNFWQSMGTANFWTNDFSQGLSFVIGAVLSETLTRGAATSALAARAGNLFHKGMKATGVNKGLKYLTAGTSDDIGKAAAQNIFTKKQMGNMATTMRQLGTGAMYEAGVEARHHYDQTISNLEDSFKDEYGRDPNVEEMAYLVDIATKSSNAVFSANVALVGYGNYLMFPKIFGRGFNGTKRSYSGFFGKRKIGIGKDGKQYKALYKDAGTTESFARNALRVLRVPMYEGFVEEGGQRLADLSGQGAAEAYFRSKEDPGFFGMVGELLNHTDDSFADTYGSKEGQKEIGIGFILGALGLPGRAAVRDESGDVIKDKITGKTKTGFKWQGGVIGTISDMKYEKKMLDAHVEKLNRDSNAIAALNNSRDSLIRAGVAQDEADFALLINSPYAYKNAESDNMFNFIHTRLQAGYEQHIYDQVDRIRNMGVQEFRDAFQWNELQDLTDEQIKDKQTEVADLMEERTADIKSTMDNVNTSFVNYDPKVKEAIVHALATGKNSDVREAGMNDRIKEIFKLAGVEVEGEMEVESRSVRDEREEISLRDRLKQLWNRFTPGEKSKILALPEAKTLMRKVGIESFTDPTHVEQLFYELVLKRKQVHDNIKELENEATEPKQALYREGKNIGGTVAEQEKWAKLENLRKEYDDINQKTNDLMEAINKGLDPDLSASEQKLLDELEGTNKTIFNEHKDELTQLFKDSHKIRARRHRMLTMVNDLMEYRDHVKQPGKWFDPRSILTPAKPGTRVPLPKMLSPRMVRDMAAENAEDISDMNLRRLFTKYQGKVVEFEYTKLNKKTKEGLVQIAREAGMEEKVVNDAAEIRQKNPETDELTSLSIALKTLGINLTDGPKTGTYRFYVRPGKPSSDQANFLISFPTKENVDLIIERRELQKLAENIKAKERIKEIDKLLEGQGQITEYRERNLSFLKSAQNIREIGVSQQVNDIISSATESAQADIQNEISSVDEKIKSFTEKVEKLALEIIEAESLRVKNREKKELAKRVFNLSEEHANVHEKLQGLEVQKVQLTAKLNELNELVTKIKEVEDEIEGLDNMSPSEKQNALAQAVSVKLQEYIKEKWNDDKTILEEHVGKGFFKNVDLLSEMFQTEEDNKRSLELANIVFDFVQNSSQLPEELVYLLDEGIADLKFRYEQSLPLLNKLRKAIHFKKDGKTYDARFSGEDEQTRRAQFESIVNEVHELKMKYESAVEILRNKLKVEMLPLFEEVNKQHGIIDKIGAVNDLFVVNFNAIQSLITELMTPEADVILETDPRTDNDAQLTDQELERDIELNEKAYYNSPSIKQVQLAKTAGNHKAALSRYNELLLKEKLTKAEQEQLEHAKDQLVFFEWSARSNNDKSNIRFENHKLVTLTRRSILDFDEQQANAEDKIAHLVGFYDHIKATSTNPRYSKSVNKEGATSQFSNKKSRDESKEDIVLLVVDDKGKPVKHNGRIVYSNMMGTETYRTEYDNSGTAHKVYRYGRADLLKVNGSVPSFKKGNRVYYTGKMSEESKGVLSQHKDFRQQIINEEALLYLTISGKSHGMQIFGVQGPDHKGMARDTIVQQESEVKNINLNVSTNPETNKVSINARQYNVNAGFLYASKDGNLIRFKINTLPAVTQNNVYNMLRLLATQVEDSKLQNASFTPQTAYLFPNVDRSIIKQLSDLIYFGKHAKGRANEKYSIYTEGDTLYFGGQSITFAQLKNADGHPEMHAELKSFLEDLHVQVNARNLQNTNLKKGPLGDVAARSENGKAIQAWYLSQKEANKKIKSTRAKYKQKKGQTNSAYNKFIYKAASLTNKEKLALKSKMPEPNYSKYIEIIVDANLNVTQVNWDNYTHFLMGTKSNTGAARSIAEIPVTVNMVQDTYSSTTDNKSFTDPQFMNIYLVYNKNSRNMNFDDLSDPTSTPIHNRQEINELDLDENVETTVEDEFLEGKAPSGVEEGKEYIFTNPENGVKVRFMVEEVDHDTSMVYHRAVALYKEDGTLVKGTEQWTTERETEFGAFFYSESYKKHISRAPIKEEELRKEKKKKEDQNVQDIKDLLKKKNNKDTTGEDIDGASLSSTSLVSMQEDFQLMNVYSEYEKFKGMVPKNSYGQPIFSVDIIQGLVHGTDFGYFTKTGKILLSTEAIRGTLYHETFHGISYKLLSPAERDELYNEVRGIKGKATTYKDEVKNLKDFTNIEADEWLAEEFRQYALSEGQYKVGSRVKKSLIQKLFDFVFQFFNNLNQTKTVFDRIHSGYYNNAVEEYTTYDIGEALAGRKGASLSKHRINSSALRDINSGMTVSLFDIIHQSKELGIEDLFTVKDNPRLLSKKLAKFYGIPGSTNTTHSRLVEQVKVQWNGVNLLLSQAIDEYNQTESESSIQKIKMLNKEQSNLESIETVLNEEWDILLNRNLLYLRQYKFNLDVRTLSEILESEMEETALTRDTLGTRAWTLNEIDLKTLVDPSIKLLLGTLPKSYTNAAGDPLVKVNKSGVYQLATFSEVVNTLYKHLSNKSNIDEIYNTLTELAKENRTYKVLLKRLGIESGLDAVKQDDYNFNQLLMLMKFIKTFNVSSEEYVTLLAKQSKPNNNPGIFFNDSNTEKIENITKTKWNYLFKDKLRNTKLGKTLPDGRVVLNINKQFSIKNPISGITRKGSLKTFANANLEFADVIPVLKILGIEFSNETKLVKTFEEGKLANFMETVSWVFGEVVKNEGDVSSIFGGEVEGNLKTLLGYEIQTSTLAITLQHVNPLGKQVFGITRKNYINMLVDKLNLSEVEIERLLQENPMMVGSLYFKEPIIKIRTIEGGKNIHQGIGYDISKTTEGNIAAAHITSILEGFTPLIRTGNKKMEKSIQIGENRYRSDEEMTSYLTDLLKAEILTANEIKNNPAVQQVKGLKSNGMKLQFFNATTRFPIIVSGSNSYIHTEKLTQDHKQLNEFLESDVVQKEIKEFLLERHKDAFDTLKSFGFISAGKKGAWNNIGLDNTHITEAYDTLSEKEKGKANIINSKITLNVLENLSTKLANNQLIGVIEQTRLFLGHTALYEDIFKRTSGMVGVKTYPVVNQDVLEAMNKTLISGSISTQGTKSKHVHRDIVRMVTRKEIKVDSAYVDIYTKRLDEMGRPDVAVSVDQTFRGMEIFDGGGFISLDFYRSVLFMTSNWSNKHEAAYQRIVQGENINSNEIALFPPLKPQVFTDMKVGGMNLKMFNKFALFPIHPNLSKLVDLKGQYTVMDDIYNDMLHNDIDYMVFESGTKVGAKTNSALEFEPLLDEFGNSIPLSDDMSYIQEFPLENFGIQLDPTMKPKWDVRLGTQSATMMFMNVFEEGFLNNKEYDDNFKALDKEYHAIHTAMIEKDKSKLARKLGFRQTNDGFEATKEHKEDMKKAVLNEMQKRDIPEHMKDTINELFSNEVSFTNLLASKQKVDDLLYSIVTNTVVARKINGRMSVIQPDVGFTLKVTRQDQIGLPGYRRLKFYEFEKDGKTVKAMEVYLPHHLKEEYGVDIDINDLSEQAKELIGFRIPTEGLNSIEFMKVAGFLPHTMGSTVIVPQEMVAKSGADYDIDKLTMYLPHLTRSKDGTVDLVPEVKSPFDLYIRDNESFMTSVVKLYGNDSKGLNSFLREFETADEKGKESLAKSLIDFGWNELEYVYKQPTAIVQNMLLKSMTSILKHPSSFPQLISPVGAFELSEIAHDIHNAQVDAGILGITKEPGTLLDKFSIKSLIKTTYQMHQTLGGTGVVASNLTDLGKSQRAGFRFKLESVSRDEWGIELSKEKYVLNFKGLENQPISLSRVYDVNGNYINRALQQYITAYVDGEKDPFAMYVNAGQSGAAIHMLLIRAGVPLPTVLKFMSQPIIQEYYRLKNLRSVPNDTSTYKQTLNEKSIKGSLIKIVGNASGVAMFNDEMLDKHNTVNGKLERAIDSMLVTNLADMAKGQKSLQAQIFHDFLRYKNYAELARKAQQLASFDTDKLRNGYNLIYLTALENFIKNKNAFEGLDAKTGPTTSLEELNLPEDLQANFPFLTSLKNVYKQTPQLFKNLDIKETVKFVDGAIETNPIKDKMVLVAEQMIRDDKSKDEVLYVLRSFDNYLTGWIWHTRLGDDQIALNSKIQELFQGSNSLPNQISKAKDVYGDNILVQDLIPVLQEFEGNFNLEYSIDKAQLFSKKYSPDEIDDLADSWYELYHMGGRAQKLAEDILAFSLLKSGVEFHPTSFFHVLPGIAILDKTTPMIEAISKTFIKGREVITKNVIDQQLYEDFLDNSWDNPNIVRTMYSNALKYKSIVFTTNEFTDDRVTILSVKERGEQKGVSAPEDKYYAAHFRLESYDENSGIGTYRRRVKKGLLGHLKEIGVVDSVIEANNHPFGRQKVKISEKVIKQIKGDKQTVIHFKFDVNDPNMVESGILVTPSGVNLSAERLATTSLKNLFTDSNYLIFDVANKKQLQLKIAQLTGHKTWGEFTKNPYNKDFMKGELRQFFNVKIVKDIAEDATPAKQDSTEQPVTQDINSLKNMYKEQQCKPKG